MMRTVLFVTAVLVARPLFALEVGLLKDINTAPAPDSGTFAFQFVELGSRTFFAAHSARHGAEPWITDGTEGGTALLLDISPGGSSILPGPFTVFNGEVYFAATDGVHGDEVWKSDGTPEGTVLLRDINPSSDSAGDNPPGDFTVFRNALYFRHTDGEHGSELWRTDGTAEGTSLVADINPGPGHSFPAGLTAAGNTLFFFADDGARGTELWKSDGTAAGTELVKEIAPSPFSNSAFATKAVLSGVFYFLTDDGTHGQELWRSDGTEAGTRMVKDIHPTSGSRIRDLTVSGGKLFFFAFTETAGFELWSSDGTEGGTKMVKDIHSGSGSSFLSITQGDPIVDLNGTLLFAASDGSTGRELWKSDGTEAGTVMVKDIMTGSESSAPSGIVVEGTKAYFSARSAANGFELWTSDGTPGGTAELKDINPAGDANPRELRFSNGLLYFSANSPLVEPWVSDGTAAGTRMLADPDTRNDGSDPHRFTAVKDQLFFRADTPEEGRELWVTDGSEGGTRLLNDLRLGPDSGNPRELTATRDYLFYVYHAPGETADSLWRTDGTNLGTEILLDKFARNLTALGDQVFFTSIFGELNKSDGTAPGTVPIKDIRPGHLGSDPHELTAMGATLFFAAFGTNEEGTELWKSDGTEAGTVLVKNIEPAANQSADPEELTAVNGTLFFSARTLTEGRELWKSDGTEAGTMLVKDINPGTNGSFPGSLFASGDTLYFSARDDSHGFELWKSDGTAEGTVLVKDIAPGNPGSSPVFAGEVGGHVLFAASTLELGTELWRTDGTEAGTVLVADLYSGPDHGTNVQFATVHDGLLYFAGRDGVHGEELWVSDGTTNGTVLFDLWPGPESSFPVAFTPFGERVYFSAEHFEIGREPFSIGPTADPGYRDWAAAQGLRGGPGEPEFGPFSDQVPHLLKYAFNLDATGPDFRVLTPGTGTSGLPVFTASSDGERATLRLEFLRRVHSTLVYAPQVSSDGLTWLPFPATETIPTIDADWERVTLSATFDPTDAPVLLGRVQVSLP